MARGPELEIDGDLFRALEGVLGAVPATPEPVVVVSVYVHSLAKGYGLSERVDEDPLVRAAVAEPAVAQVAHYLPESESTNADSLRDRLYSVFVEISRDTRALKILNRGGQLADVELLKAAQIYWNLEADERTPLLPIRSGQKITTNGTTVLAGIKVPNANKDFATMKWTARINQKEAHQSSGQGFRNLGARLAVLAARLIVAGASQTPPSLGDASLDLDRTKKRASIVWPDTERVSAAPAATPAEHVRAIADLPAPVVPDQPGASQSLWLAPAQVLVGSFAEVGSSYQRRGFDAEIDRLWAEGGDRRVWLRGKPGLGKSYTARRVMQDAVACQGDDREDLLIWVESADPQSVRQSFSSAVDRMPQLGVSVAPQAPDRVDRQARALLEMLARSTWRWLIVLDNADAGGLIEAGLIPAGGNPNGRVLITTRSQDQRITGNGPIVVTGLFTPPEAEAFLRAQVDPRDGGPAPLARATTADTTALAKVVGFHPLALSIAAATVVANAMDLADWITEFTTTARMDAAADEPDPGGYRHLIGATWRIALEKASQGLADGLAERAAMVAAVQDPDGHPTWLWDRDSVARWVADGPALVRPYRMPSVVQRLIDHGILEMRGDTWRGGKLAIHQLAARAVRELASTDDVADLAAILVNEWLLHLTEDEAGTRSALRRNIEALVALPALTSSTKQATTALLGYSLRGGTPAYEQQWEAKEGVAEHLAKGGVSGQAVRAYQLATLGDSAEELGLFDEARASHTEAAKLYEQVIGSPSVDDDERGDHLKVLGKLYEKLGHPDRAREVFTRALRIYEQALGVDSDWVNLVYLIGIAELHKALGKRDAFVAAIERAEGAIGTRTDDELLEAMRDTFDRLRWEAMADRLRLLGRLDQATRLLKLRAEAPKQDGKEADRSVLRKLALIDAEAGQWGEAEDVLARVTTGEEDKPDDLVLLASIQMHLGRVDDAEKSIARAAKIYREHEPDRPTHHYDPSSVRDAVLQGSLLAAVGEAAGRKRWDDAAGLYEVLVDFHGKHADLDPGEHEQDLAKSNLGLGMAKFQSGQPGEAVEPLTRAANIYQMLADLNPDDQKAQSGLVWAFALLAAAHGLLHRPDEAVDHLRRAMNIVSAIPDPDSKDRSAQEAFALHLVVLGYVSTELGKLDEAAYSYLRLVGIRLMTAKLAPGSAIAERNLARAEYLLGSVDQQLGQLDSAEKWLASAVYWRQELADLDPDDRDAQAELAQALAKLGTVHLRLERIDEAEHAWTRAVEIRRTLADAEPDDRDAQKGLAVDLAILGGFYRAVDRLEDAVDCQTRATNVFLLLVDLAPGNPEPEVVKVTILTLNQLADALRSLGRLDEAGTATVRAEGLARRFPDLESNEGA